ncbi:MULTISPECIES: hypothetical protein [unclassified Streptomyces]|uniref:hypothetical protein n=1 Tax=unclassified Streptomyces TaxID=2593676 RepID=UPI000978F99C|nr:MULTISPECIES: hypothetical protein [unclassified Streptomyces]ONI48672.1 hypothetical protein STIB_72260 [Streptomyces sp. IB2014 011-1]RDV48202.1 hypothetical protein DDV98_28970 [Streptomyces sp. IB2014 011-12]
MSAPQDDALAKAVAEHGPFPMPVGTTDEVARSQGMHADSKACGTCRALVRDGKPIEHEQCAARAVLLLPPDQPVYENLVDLTDEQRKALPARFHTPVFDGLGQPNAWLCQVCWGDGWVSQWPCGPAQEKGAMVFVSEGTAEDIAAELVALRKRVAELEALKPAQFQDCQVCGTGYEYGQPCSFCQFKERLAAEIAKLPAEDPHDSPLHHSYAVGRDLPEVDPARCLDTHPFSPRDGWRLICGSCDHAKGAPCHRDGGAL